MPIDRRRSGARSERAQRLAAAGVYLVTDDALDPDTLLARLDQALAAGVGVVQYRSKQPRIPAVLELGRRVRDRCREHGALFFANDRADLALALDADGLHVGQDDLPPTDARPLLGSDRVLGLSVSYLDEADRADAMAELDYIGFGAIYPTATKPDAEYAGLDLLRQVRGRTRLPIVAIGGITLDNAAEVIHAGADLVAVVSEVFQAADAGVAVQRLLEAVRTAHGG
jgi:thiamine-phosphate pyrophosphorylase